MLLTRIASAILLLPMVVVLIWIGGWAFEIAIAGVMSLAIYEFNQLMRQGGHPRSVPLLFSITLLVIIVLSAIFPQANLLQPGIAFVLVASLTWQLGHRQDDPTVAWALALASGLYLGVAGAHFIMLRQLPNGQLWLLLTLTGTWLADSGAYFVGSWFGRHKLTPALSPKKSWEGLIGGAIFGPALNLVVAAILGLPLIHGAALGLVGATIGTLGDLSISMVKRQVGAKDSGRLIPGHGGMLDRLDSLLFTVIIGYYYIAWIARPQ
jgi:phosphatidate cytidylyltransferase